MHTALLLIHVAGAGYLGLTLVRTVLSLLKNDTETYAPYARWIAGMLVLQTVSGCLLVLEARQPISAFAFCSKFALYVVPALGIECALFFRMLQKHLEAFPVPFVVRAFCVSAFIAIGTLFVPLQ